MKTIYYLLIIGIAVICVVMFPDDLSPLSELYKTGKIRIEQEYVLDDDSMPEDIFFDNPSTVTCDPEGNVYVVDSGAKNIKKFDGHGKFLKTIEPLGV